MKENQIATVIVDCAFKVHNALGPGLLEAVYEAAMVYELTQRGLNVTAQQGIPASYHDVKLDVGFRADIIVENKVIIEIKSVEALALRMVFDELLMDCDDFFTQSRKDRKENQKRQSGALGHK